MMPVYALPLLLLLADGAEEPKWKFDSREEGVTVMRRDRPGSEVRELKATGTIDAPPAEVWKVITRFSDYKKVIPFAEKTGIVATEQDGKVVHLYVLQAPPMISKRDYCVKYVDGSNWQDGKGFLQLDFSLSDKAPPEKKDVVRIKTMEGQWRLEAREDGKKTFATYRLFTHPGGSIPAWLVNGLSGSSMRDLFRNVRQMTTASH